MSKIKPNGIKPGGSQYGTTLYSGNPSKFVNKGTSQKKHGDGTSSIAVSPGGPTFAGNKTLIKDMGKAGSPGARVVNESNGKLGLDKLKTAEKFVASGGSGVPYALKSDYDKSGKTMKKSHSLF